MNIYPVGVELYHADGRTDGRTKGHEVNSSFSQFCGSVLKETKWYFQVKFGRRSRLISVH